MRTLGLCPGSCFPPEVLPQHWPPLLRWVRVPIPFPTIFARMQPSDSPCRFSTPPVFPRSCLTKSRKRRFCAPRLPVVRPAVGPLAADGASEWVTGSP